MSFLDLISAAGVAAFNRRGRRYTSTKVRGGFTPASINRNTGQPHEHKREIARRTRQAERRAAK